MVQRYFQRLRTGDSPSSTGLEPVEQSVAYQQGMVLFEKANSINDPDVKFSIQLAKSEVKEMSTAVIDDSDCLIQMVTDIQAENTDATLPDDLMLIFDVIRKSWWICESE